MQPYVEDAVIWSPQTAQEYIKGLENQTDIQKKSRSHALSKHGWETPDSVLKEAAIKNPGTSQTRLVDPGEMAGAIKTTIEANLDIT